MKIVPSNGNIMPWGFVKYSFLTFPNTRLEATSNEEDALASFKGDKGVLLRVIGTADGGTVSEQKLDAMPVFDGISAARGRVFVSLRDGQIQCWE